MVTQGTHDEMTTGGRLREILEDVSLLWSATTLLEHSTNEELIDALPRHLGDIMLRLRGIVAEIEGAKAA